jgi:hypothetical protein
MFLKDIRNSIIYKRFYHDSHNKLEKYELLDILKNEIKDKIKKEEIFKNDIKNEIKEEIKYELKYEIKEEIKHELKYEENYKKNYILTQEQKEVLVGGLLGDMFLQKSKASKNARLQFKQCLEHKEYFNNVYQIFSPLIVMKPHERSDFDKREKFNKIYENISFTTLAFPCFNYYHNLFYLKKEDKGYLKIIPSNIYDLLTLRGLAY